MYVVVTLGPLWRGVLTSLPQCLIDRGIADHDNFCENANDSQDPGAACTSIGRWTVVVEPCASDVDSHAANHTAFYHRVATTIVAEQARETPLPRHVVVVLDPATHGSSSQRQRCLTSVRNFVRGASHSHSVRHGAAAADAAAAAASADGCTNITWLYFQAPLAGDAAGSARGCAAASAAAAGWAVGRHAAQLFSLDDDHPHHGLLLSDDAWEAIGPGSPPLITKSEVGSSAEGWDAIFSLPKEGPALWLNSAISPFLPSESCTDPEASSPPASSADGGTGFTLVLVSGLFSVRSERHSMGSVLSASATPPTVTLTAARELMRFLEAEASAVVAFAGRRAELAPGAPLRDMLLSALEESGRSFVFFIMEDAGDGAGLVGGTESLGYGDAASRMWERSTLFSFTLHSCCFSWAELRGKYPQAALLLPRITGSDGERTPPWRLAVPRPTTTTGTEVPEDTEKLYNTVSIVHEAEGIDFSDSAGALLQDAWTTGGAGGPGAGFDQPLPSMHVIAAPAHFVSSWSVSGGNSALPPDTAVRTRGGVLWDMTVKMELFTAHSGGGSSASSDPGAPTSRFVPMLLQSKALRHASHETLATATRWLRGAGPVVLCSSLYTEGVVQLTLREGKQESAPIAAAVLARGNVVFATALPSSSSSANSKAPSAVEDRVSVGALLVLATCVSFTPEKVDAPEAKFPTAAQQSLATVDGASGNVAATTSRATPSHYAGSAVPVTASGLPLFMLNPKKAPARTRSKKAAGTAAATKQTNKVKTEGKRGTPSVAPKRSRQGGASDGADIHDILADFTVKSPPDHSTRPRGVKRQRAASRDKGEDDAELPFPRPADRRQKLDVEGGTDLLRGYDWDPLLSEDDDDSDLNTAPRPIEKQPHPESSRRGVGPARFPQPISGLTRVADSTAFDNICRSSSSSSYASPERTLDDADLI